MFGKGWILDWTQLWVIELYFWWRKIRPQFITLCPQGTAMVHVHDVCFRPLVWSSTEQVRLYSTQVCSYVLIYTGITWEWVATGYITITCTVKPLYKTTDRNTAELHNMYIASLYISSHMVVLMTTIFILVNTHVLKHPLWLLGLSAGT